MAELLHLTQPWAFAYVDNHGKEVHGNGRFNSKMEALIALCKNANLPLTEEVKEDFGVAGEPDDLSAEVMYLKEELTKLKEMQLKTFDLASEKQKTEGKKTPAKQPSKGQKTIVKKKVNAK